MTYFEATYFNSTYFETGAVVVIVPAPIGRAHRRRGREYLYFQNISVRVTIVYLLDFRYPLVVWIAHPIVAKGLIQIRVQDPYQLRKSISVTIQRPYLVKAPVLVGVAWPYLSRHLIKARIRYDMDDYLLMTLATLNA